MSIGPWQIILIIAIVLIFFGPKRIPGLGKSLGEAIKGFKKGISDDAIDVTDSSKEASKEKIEEGQTAEYTKETEKEKADS